MQSIALRPPSLFSTPFGPPGLDQGPERLSLDLGRSASARGWNPRALTLLRPMSSSEPARDALVTSEELKHPRRPELSQIVTTTVADTFAPPLVPSSPATAEAKEPSSQRLVSYSGSGLSQRPLVNDPLPPRLPPVLGGQETAKLPEPPPSAAFTTSPPWDTAQTLTHKPSRRTKAHVASACVNCKKKHLGCDSARPCRRCVLAGKAATCVDVTHKKRGRPPLKAEEAPLRPYAPLESPTSSIAPPLSSEARHPSIRRGTPSRELRPSTDLQFADGGAGAFGLMNSTGQPQRWGASILPRTLDPSLSMPGFGQRRFSGPGSLQKVTPGFIPIAPGLNPGLDAGRMPRPLESPTLPTVTSPRQYQPQYGPPIPPYVNSPRAVNRPPIGHSPAEIRGLTSPESPVRLPPIFTPTTMTGPMGHRLSDPHPTPWPLRPQERPRPVSQGQVGLLAPRTQFRPSAPSAGYTEPPASQPGPVSSTHECPVPPPPTPRRDRPASTEAESGEARPTKRRKMALDDMVND